MFLSYEPPEWPASPRQGHACDFIQTHHRAAAQRGPRGPGPDQGLQQLTAAPLQEARLQKLLQHLPTLGNTPPLQHTVSASFEFPLPPQQLLCFKLFPFVVLAHFNLYLAFGIQ